METATLYVMISKTDTGIGKVIRAFSRYPYNHVALTLDPSFRTWFAFARYNCDAPFYGGFACEPVERYLAGGESVDVRIFELEIPMDRYRQLAVLFSKAGPECELIYNMFDIVAAIFGKKIHVCGAYTCLSFACAVLGKRYLTIKALDRALSPYLLFEGSLCSLVRDSGCRDDRYFQKLGVLQAASHSLEHFSALCSRAIRANNTDIVTQYT